MPLTADELTVMRGWVGDTTLVTDATLNSLFDGAMNGSYDATVLYVLRERRVGLVSQPSSLSVPGLSVTNTSNIEAIEKLIKDFVNQGGTHLDPDDTGLDNAISFSVSHFVRDDLR